jgi:hypothetical protein
MIMPAYYVDSGDLHTKIFAINPHEACKRALNKFVPTGTIKNLNPIILVNELGPNKVDKDTSFGPTHKILEEVGLAGKYQIDVEEIDQLFADMFAGIFDGENGDIDFDNIDNFDDYGDDDPDYLT